MKVKYHKLQRNAEGELVDAVCDDEGLPIYMLNEIEFNALQTGKKLLPDNVAFIVVKHEVFDKRQCNSMLGMIARLITTPVETSHYEYKCSFWETNPSAGKGKNIRCV